MGTVGSNPTPSAIGSRRPGASLTKVITAEQALYRQHLVVATTGKESTMARARSTFGKLQRDQAKKDRARAKMDDRQSRREDKAADDLEGGTSSNGEVVDQTRLLEQFAALHEDLADGRISLDDFEVRQEELRAKMVVE
jgi:hypothetical protein